MDFEIQFSYKEIKSDLFDLDKSYSLAHCVSQDFKMGKGIAKLFKVLIYMIN